MVLALAAIGWSLLAARGRPEADPWPYVALCAGLVVATAAGRRLAGPDPAVLPGAVAAGVTGALVLTFPGLLSADGAPTGYANANATLAALGMVAAAAAATQTTRTDHRRAWWVLGLLLAGAVVATGSLAGVLAMVAVVGLAGLTVWRGNLAAVVAGGLVAASVTLGATVAIAQGADLAGLRERSDVRGELWAAAAELTAEDPGRGMGPGGFAARNPVTSDLDLRWAHHGYLQQSAEQGLVGLVLLLAALGWVYARLWVGRASRQVASTVVGAAATTVVALHASVDHVLHHAAVPLTLALLVGWATADLRGPGSPGSHRPHR